MGIRVAANSGGKQARRVVADERSIFWHQFLQHDSLLFKIQKLVSEPAIETLDEGVLDWLTWRDAVAVMCEPIWVVRLSS